MTEGAIKDRATPVPGTLVGKRYRLVRTLGEGGMGTVYEALDEELGGRVAIKLIRHGLEDSPNSVKRFRREAEAAAAAGHEAIVGVFDFGVTDEGTHFLVMELLVGMSLCDLLDERGKLDIPTTAYVSCQVLSGLSAAHRVGVIHRDLKPDNIFLVQPHSSTPGVKILDFGTSLLVGERGGGLFMTRITREGAVIGTPEYMSTEQAKGRLDIDSRTDLYSLGVIMYECLTGRPPFTSKQPTDIIYQILTQTPAELRTIRAETPEAFESLVMWSFFKERDRRPQSCRELYDALLPYVEPSARAFLIPPVEEQEKTEPNHFKTRQIDLEEMEGLALKEMEGLVHAATVQATPLMPEPHQGDNENVEDLAVTIPMHVADVGALIEQRRATAQAPTFVLDSSASPGVSPNQQVQALSQRSTRFPNTLLILLFAGLAVVVIVLGMSVGLWFALSTTNNVENVKPVAPLRSPPDDPEGSDEAERPEGEVPPTAQAVCVVMLRNLPDGARVYVDGALVEGLPLRLARGNSTHELRIEADGFEEFRHVIDASVDQTIDVVMTRNP